MSQFRYYSAVALSCFIGSAISAQTIDLEAKTKATLRWKTAVVAPLVLSRGGELSVVTETLNTLSVLFEDARVHLVQKQMVASWSISFAVPFETQHLTTANLRCDVRGSVTKGSGSRALIILRVGGASYEKVIVDATELGTQFRESFRIKADPKGGALPFHVFVAADRSRPSEEVLIELTSIDVVLEP